MTRRRSIRRCCYRQYSILPKDKSTGRNGISSLGNISASVADEIVPNFNQIKSNVPTNYLKIIIIIKFSAKLKGLGNISASVFDEIVPNFDRIKSNVDTNYLKFNKFIIIIKFMKHF